MAGDKQPNVQIVWHHVSIMERFSSVLYPLDIVELLKGIPNIGYIVPELVLRGTPELDKPLATRGDIELMINQENKTIGVKGRNVEKTIESFQELREYYLKQMDASPGLATHYVEFQGQGWAKSNANPNEVFGNFWANHIPLQNMGKLFGTDLTNFGIQLAPARKDPNDPDWLHIFIEPLIAASSRRYQVRLIWRSSEIKDLLVKFSKIDETLQKLVSKLEG